MPVEDHPVHEKVKRDSSFRYGCNSVNNPNRSMTGYYAPERKWYGEKFETIIKFIPFRMSKPCRNFYLWDVDPACADCATLRDVEYADKMKGLE